MARLATRWSPRTSPIWAVDLGRLGSTSGRRTRHQEHADELRIDLDPSPGGTLPCSRGGAGGTRLFDELGLSATEHHGNRGSTVCSAPAALDGLRGARFGVAVARELQRRRPAPITSAWWKEEWGERIFIDFNQNAPHKTISLPAVRARDRAQCRRLCLGRVRADPRRTSCIVTVPLRLRALAIRGPTCPAPQSLEPLLAMHERDTAAGLPDAAWPPVYPKMPGEPPRVAPSRAKPPRPAPPRLTERRLLADHPATAPQELANTPRQAAKLSRIRT